MPEKNRRCALSTKNREWPPSNGRAAQAGGKVQNWVVAPKDLPPRGGEPGQAPTCRDPAGLVAAA